MFELKSPKEILALAGVHHPSGGTSRTKQAEAELTDVNLIVRRHRKTGAVTHLNGRIPQYGDFSDATNLLDAHLRVQEASDMFAELPAEVRRAAGHDPVQLMEMLADQEGTELLVEAGLDATIIDREIGSPEATEASSTTDSAESDPPPAAQPGDSVQGAT